MNEFDNRHKNDNRKTAILQNEVLSEILAG